MCTTLTFSVCRFTNLTSSIQCLNCAQIKGQKEKNLLACVYIIYNLVFWYDISNTIMHDCEFLSIDELIYYTVIGIG